VSGETFKRWADIDIVHVHYKSAPPAINDVLGGSVSMMFADITTALPHVRARTLRGLAVTGPKRNSLLPDLPSMHEAGLTGFDVASWNGVWAPAKTPGYAGLSMIRKSRRSLGNWGLKRSPARRTRWESLPKYSASSGRE
jgi:tripartite-type tricarboxylate transporter receptor subunit TctC